MDTNSNRFLFAMARGARVAVINKEEAFLEDQDKHLEYGPLSSTLIDLAIYSPEPNPEMIEWAAACLGYANSAKYSCKAHSGRRYGFDSFDDYEITRRMFWLFCAEMLADEGL